MTMQMKIVSSLAAVLFAGAVVVSAQQRTGTTAIGPGQDHSGSLSKTTTTAPKSADESFVKEVAQGGVAEVELGKLATEKASNDRVKQFGQKMVTDHTKANDELKPIATSKNIPIASNLNSKHQATYNRMKGMPGAAFDRAYVSDMLRDHEKDVVAFRKESTSGQDPDVKAFAAKTLPTLEEHLKMIRDLSKEIGATATGN
jgi:putative membrane protein